MDQEELEKRLKRIEEMMRGVYIMVAILSFVFFSSLLHTAIFGG